MPFGKGEQIRRRWAQVIGAARLKRTRTEVGIRCSYVTSKGDWHFSYPPGYGEKAGDIEPSVPHG